MNADESDYGWIGGSGAGRAIRTRRRAKGMTQSELARKVGMSRHHLSNIENGADASLAMYRRIAEALETTAYGLVLEMTSDDQVAMETADATIGQTIRSLRRAKGITQHELAKGVGVTNDWISTIERGAPCSSKLLEKILRQLDVPDAERYARQLEDPEKPPTVALLDLKTLAEHKLTEEAAASVERQIRYEPVIRDLKARRDAAKEEARRVRALPSSTQAEIDAAVRAHQLLDRELSRLYRDAEPHPSTYDTEPGRLAEIVANTESEDAAREWLIGALGLRASRLRAHLHDLGLVSEQAKSQSLLNSLKVLIVDYDVIRDDVVAGKTRPEEAAAAADLLATSFAAVSYGAGALVAAAREAWKADVILRGDPLSDDNVRAPWEDKLKGWTPRSQYPTGLESPYRTLIIDESLRRD